MPYTSLTTVTAGQTIDPAWGTLVDTNLDFLANPPACRVYNSANIVLTNNTHTPLTFNSERYDTDGMHSTSVNTSRITINTAGLYTVTGTVELAAQTDYTRWYVGLYINGTTFIALMQEFPGTGGSARDATITTTYKFAVADYVELAVLQQNSAAAARNILAASAYSPELAATWVGLG